MPPNCQSGCNINFYDLFPPMNEITSVRVVFLNSVLTLVLLFYLFIQKDRRKKTLRAGQASKTLLLSAVVDEKAAAYRQKEASLSLTRLIGWNQTLGLCALLSSATSHHWIARKEEIFAGLQHWQQPPPPDPRVRTD